MSKNILHEGNIMFKDIDEYEDRLRISMEGLDTYLSGLKNFFLRKFTSLSNIIGKISSDTLPTVRVGKGEYNTEIKHLIALKSSLASTAEYLKYDNYAEKSFPTIPGLKVDYLELSTKLADIVPSIKENVYKDVDEADSVVGRYLGDEGYRIASYVDTKAGDEIKARAEQYYAMLNSVIDDKLFADTTKFKNMVPNLSSLITVVDNIAIAGDGLTLEFLKNLNIKLEALSAKVKTLLDVVQKNPSMQSSKVVTKYLSSIVYDVANEVSYAIAIVHLVNESATMMKYVINQIK